MEGIGLGSTLPEPLGAEALVCYGMTDERPLTTDAGGLHPDVEIVLLGETSAVLTCARKPVGKLYDVTDSTACKCVNSISSRLFSFIYLLSTGFLAV